MDGQIKETYCQSKRELLSKSLINRWWIDGWTDRPHVLDERSAHGEIIVDETRRSEHPVTALWSVCVQVHACACAA